jgi:hypothetical protein
MPPRDSPTRIFAEPSGSDVAGQPDLFGDPSPPAYVPDPRHVRNRLVEMVGKMEAARSWPWEPVTVRLYRETVWPYLLARIPDAAEAAEWRGRIEAEAERLDRAGAA